MLEQQGPEGIERYVGRELVSGDGEKIGNIGEIYYNRLTGVPEWLGVEAGIFDRHYFVVPVAGVSFEPESIRSQYPAEIIREAPTLATEDGLPPEADSILSNYYGLGAR